MTASWINTAKPWPSSASFRLGFLVGAGFGHSLPRLLLAVCRQVADLLPLRLAALSTLCGVFAPGATVAAPAFARVEALGHKNHLHA
jgi:hypothetical protein